MTFSLNDTALEIGRDALRLGTKLARKRPLEHGSATHLSKAGRAFASLIRGKPSMAARPASHSTK
jgi:hypothetical protein